MRPVNVPFKLYVVELWSALPLKLFVVESWTTYCVTVAGFSPAVHVTVIDVKFTAVHVLAAVTGILASVAVVTFVLHALVLALITLATLP